MGATYLVTTLHFFYLSLFLSLFLIYMRLIPRSIDIGKRRIVPNDIFLLSLSQGLGGGSVVERETVKRDISSDAAALLLLTATVVLILKYCLGWRFIRQRMRHFYERLW